MLPPKNARPALVKVITSDPDSVQITLPFPPFKIVNVPFVPLPRIKAAVAVFGVDSVAPEAAIKFNLATPVDVFIISTRVVPVAADLAEITGACANVPEYVGETNKAALMSDPLPDVIVGAITTPYKNCALLASDVNDGLKTNPFNTSAAVEREVAEPVKVSSARLFAPAVPATMFQVLLKTGVVKVVKPVDVTLNLPLAAAVPPVNRFKVVAPSVPMLNGTSLEYR